MIKIAMCDDETIQLMKMKRMIGEYLSRKQILSQIECFESGKELLRKMTEGQCYDVVFLDANMEEIDGLETGYFFPISVEFFMMLRLYTGLGSSLLPF